MRVLLLSMPDSFEHTPALTMRMPNGALASLAANAGPGQRVAIADLILVQRSVGPTVERLMRDLDPEVVGLSIMTFQRRTALRLIRLIRGIKPDVTVVAGLPEMVGGWLPALRGTLDFLPLPGPGYLTVLSVEPRPFRLPPALAAAEVLVSAAQTAVLVRIRIMAAAARATGRNDPAIDLGMW